MAKAPKIPGPRTQVDQTEKSIDYSELDDHKPDEIQKGMPDRNIRAWVTIVLIACLVGYLTISSHSSREKSAPIVQAPTPSSTDILLSLEQSTRSLPPIPPPLEVSPQRIEAPVSQFSTTESVDERELAALVSSTAASDVSVRAQQLAPASQRRQEIDEIKNFLSERQARADSIADMVLKSQQPPSGGGSGRISSLGFGDDAGDARSSSSGHEEFIRRNAPSSAGLPAPQSLMQARSPHTLYEGTIIRAILTRELKTDLPGMVTAKVTTDLYDTRSQRTLLIPRGSEIICNYQSELMVGQELVLAACTRLRLPNGKSFSLMGATASDMQGASGLPADINNHFFKMFKSALIVGAASRLLPKDERQISVASNDSGVSTGGSILGSALSKVIDATISRNVRIPPTGHVAIGTPFTLTLSRDVELEPYF